MLLRLFNVLLIFLAVQAICNANTRNEDIKIDLPHFPLSVRDPETGIEYKGTFVSSKQGGPPFALTYNDLPCHCENSKCTCCSNLRVLHLSWNMCLNAALRSEQPPFLLSLTLNNDVVLEHNALLDIPSTCVRIFDWNFLQLCVGVKDIYFDGRKLHFCPQVHIKIFTFPEITLFYKCININADGISIENSLLEYNRTVSRMEHLSNESSKTNLLKITPLDEELQIEQLRD